MGGTQQLERGWLQSIDVVLLGAWPQEAWSHWKSESFTETAKLSFRQLLKDK